MSETTPDLVPRPGALRRRPGHAQFSDGMVIAADAGSTGVADLLACELGAATGWHVEKAGPDAGSTHGVVRLQVAGRSSGAAGGSAPFPDPAGENYRLVADENGVKITAPTAAGVFYGTRTLRQLMPADLLRRAPSSSRSSVEVEAVEIEDGPRFGWRGMGLDVARHFFPKEFILKLIDLASFHKLNVLHLHLTDDQGWRVQVDRYPLLTEVGAWRRESPAGHYSEHRKDATPHGGFYSKADLAEICAYAARHFVNILPEIDMPGHMQAAIASYPELGNTGEKLEVFTDWGISDHVLNLEPATVKFCGDVLDEVTDIFPGRLVHVGGDECPTTEWEASPRARELMGRLGLSEARQLQGWFTAQVSEVLSSRGRQLVGWNEVLEAGAPAGAVVMAWQEHEAWDAAKQAAQLGHDVVMAPEAWCYFDWSYSDDPREPLAIRPAISVEKAYSLEPMPADLGDGLARHVTGAQCQLWTEYVTTTTHAEYMYFPRACALAEVGWSSKERDWPDFERRLASHMARLAALGVAYRPLSGPLPGQSRIWSQKC